MMDLEGLSTEELSLFSRQAGEACFFRFGQIAGASDPSDRALQELLVKMALEAQRQAQPPPGQEERPSPPLPGSLTLDEIREIIRGALPSLMKGFGEGMLHRDIALFFAESLEEEASRFYRMLAGHAREWQARELFIDLSERERGKLRFLREIVLQS